MARVGNGVGGVRRQLRIDWMSSEKLVCALLTSM